MRILKRRAPRKQTCLVVYGVTRASRVGVAIVMDGKQVAWGVDETAAMAALEINRASVAA